MVFKKKLETKQHRPVVAERREVKKVTPAIEQPLS